MIENRGKSATILAIDMAGYSARAEIDQAAAAAAAQALKARASAAVETHGGRVFNTAGDGAMAEFAAASDALAAAFLLLDEAPRDAPAVRIGLHVGEVIAGEDDDIFGHGVNVAARLQTMAAPGTALLSRAVAELVHGEVRARLVRKGRLPLDKMAQTIEALVLDPKARRGRARAPRRRRAWLLPALAGAAALAGLGAALLSSSVIAPRRVAKEFIRDPAALREITGRVTAQLIAEGRAGDGALDEVKAAIDALGASATPEDRAALQLLHDGQTARAAQALEEFGADLSRNGSAAAAGAAFERAAALALSFDARRALRDAERALALAPRSTTAFENALMANRQIAAKLARALYARNREDYPAALALVEEVRRELRDPLMERAYHRDRLKILFFVGDFERALTEGRQIIEARERRPAA